MARTHRQNGFVAVLEILRRALLRSPQVSRLHQNDSEERIVFVGANSPTNPDLLRYYCQCVILSEGRSPQSNFCGLRHSRTSKSARRSRSGIYKGYTIAFSRRVTFCCKESMAKTPREIPKTHPHFCSEKRAICCTFFLVRLRKQRTVLFAPLRMTRAKRASCYNSVERNMCVNWTLYNYISKI